MESSGMLRRVDLVRTDVSEEHIASIIRVTRIGEVGTLALTSHRHTLRRFLQGPHGVTSQKTPFFIFKLF
jgi:demethoxyubiquinone hydroxylase (CLK1/Coq7/Cat5 family)